MTPSFWRDRRVFLTGHTGFKGGWLALWLARLGARTAGYALAPAASSLYQTADIRTHMTVDTFGDVRDHARLRSAIAEFEPEIVFHMAGQPLVRQSYQEPLETFSTNVMGTANLLEALRSSDTLRALVCVTSDKCYENREWVWGYRENDRLGGHDPYAASKSCQELAVAAFRDSFLAGRGVGVATVRAGNVLGGGDWAADRLVPDLVRAFMAGRPAIVRNPDSVRPWQHVLDPLYGYLLLAERLWSEHTAFSGPWNFGPEHDGAVPAKDIADRMTRLWGGDAAWLPGERRGGEPKETRFLALDWTKARNTLGWAPAWGLDRTLSATVSWYQAYSKGSNVSAKTFEQISSYLADRGISSVASEEDASDAAGHPRQNPSLRSVDERATAG